MFILLKKWTAYFLILNGLMGCTKENNDTNINPIKNTRWKIVNSKPSIVILSFYNDDTYEFKNIDGTIREYGNYSYTNSSIVFERTSQILNIPSTRNKYTLVIDVKNFNMITLKGSIITIFSKLYYIDWVLIKD